MMYRFDVCKTRDRDANARAHRICKFASGKIERLETLYNASGSEGEGGKESASSGGRYTSSLPHVREVLFGRSGLGLAFDAGRHVGWVTKGGQGCSAKNSQQVLPLGVLSRWQREI